RLFRLTGQGKQHGIIVYREESRFLTFRWTPRLPVARLRPPHEAIPQLSIRPRGGKAADRRRRPLPSTSPADLFCGDGRARLRPCRIAPLPPDNGTPLEG